MRTLSLDLGRTKTGVAVSQEDLDLISPLRPVLVNPLTHGRQWFDSLIQVLNHYALNPWDIETVVIGSWESRDHRNSEMEAIVKGVVELLEAKTDWRVELVSEVYSTVESRRILKGMGVKGKRQLRSLDCYAASLILMDYLELVRPRKNEG